MATRYPCQTIEEMAAIPIEARGRFLAEFPEMLKTIDGIREMESAIGGAFLVKFTPGMFWTDDNAKTATVTLTAPDGSKIKTVSKFTTTGAE